MKGQLTDFEQLLVTYYRENRFPALLLQDFLTILLTNEPVIDDMTHYRIFVYLIKFEGDTVEMLFRPQDADMIDYEALELILETAYSDGECIDYNLEGIEDGEIIITFDPDYHHRIDQFELVVLLEDAIDGIIKTLELELYD